MNSPFVAVVRVFPAGSLRHDIIWREVGRRIAPAALWLEKRSLEYRVQCLIWNTPRVLLAQ